MKLNGPSGGSGRTERNAASRGASAIIAVVRCVAGGAEVHPLQRRTHVDGELRLDHAGLLERQHVEELVGVELIEQIDQRQRQRRRVGNAQAGDGAYPVGMADRRMPGDRRPPVVAGQDDRLVAQRTGHCGHVACQLPQRVPLDLGWGGAPAVAAHVHRRNRVAPLGEVGHLMPPRMGQLGPSVHAQDLGPSPVTSTRSVMSPLATSSSFIGRSCRDRLGQQRVELGEPPGDVGQVPGDVLGGLDIHAEPAARLAR